MRDRLLNFSFAFVETPCSYGPDFFLLRANQCVWLPVSYQFCNFLVLAVGVGAVVAQTDHAISELVSCRRRRGGAILDLLQHLFTPPETPQTCCKLWFTPA